MKPQPPKKRNPKPKEVTGKVKEVSKLDEQFAFFTKAVEERIFFAFGVINEIKLRSSKDFKNGGTVIYPNFKNESDLTAYKNRIKKIKG